LERIGESEEAVTHGARPQGWMDKRAFGSVCIHLGALTGDAPDCRARGAGRGERGARRQGGGLAGDLDTGVGGVARGGSLHRSSEGRRRPPAAGPALDCHAGVDRALGAATRDPLGVSAPSPLPATRATRSLETRGDLTVREGEGATPIHCCTATR